MELLIADRDRNITEDVIRSIRGYQTDCHLSVVDSGQKCLAMINNKIDLIILSTEISDIYILDLIEKIRDNSDIPIIVLSRDNDVIKLVKALEVGANDYIEKPINHLIFAAKVKAIIRRHLMNNKKDFQ